MFYRLILEVTKFQLPPSKRLSTVVKNILRPIMPPMSNSDISYELYPITEDKLAKNLISGAPYSERSCWRETCVIHSHSSHLLQTKETVSLSMLKVFYQCGTELEWFAPNAY